MEEGRISGSELFWLIIGFIIGSAVIFSPGGAEVKHDVWIGLLLGLVEGIGFAIIYLILALRFPGKTIVEICDLVYGKICGKLVSISYIGYLFHLGSLVLGNFADFFTGVIFPETPAIVFLIMLALVCCYAARSGVEVFSRSSQILVPITGLTFLVTTIALIKEFNPANFLPIFDVPVSTILSSGHATATYPFGESVAFLMIIPFLNQLKETPGKVIKALITAGLLLLLGILRIVGVLGNLADIYVYPSYQAGRMISFGTIFTRLEILTALSFVTMGFLKVTVLLYGTALGTAQMFKFKDYRFLINPLAVLMVLLSLLNFSSVTENIEFNNKIYPLWAVPFQVGIPLLTLIIAWLRRKKLVADGYR